jgi:hypothetical protein
MKAQSIPARIFYVLAAIGFAVAGWKEHGLIVPLGGVIVAAILVYLASRNARKRKERSDQNG